MTAARSAGQSDMGGTAVVAGAASRSTPTGFKRCRSITALVNWVVPSITAAIRSGAAPPCFKTVPAAATIASAIPTLVATLCQDSTWSPSISTASVLVPPTSIPKRSQRLGMDLFGRLARLCNHALRLGFRIRRLFPASGQRRCTSQQFL